MATERGSFKTWVSMAAAILAVFIAAGVAMWSAYLLVVGMPGVRVPVEIVHVTPEVPRTPLAATTEVSRGDATQEARRATVVHEPYPPAIVPLLASGLMVIGLFIGRLRVSWIGLAILFGFSVLFLFSMGAGLLPVDITLLALLGIIQYLGGWKGVLL